MYTDSDDLGKENHGESAIDPWAVWGEQTGLQPDPNPGGMGTPGNSSNQDGNLSIGISRTVRAWVDSVRSADRSPGGIASRLLDAKLQQLGEVRGRYQIVLRRKIEYEESIIRLEAEITEIQGIAAELLQLDQPPDT